MIRAAAYLASAIDASLLRMGVDHIDLWQIHRPDMLTHPAEVARALEDAHRAGKIGAIGVSNHSPAQTDALAAHLAVPLVSHQPEFSPLALDALTGGVFDQAMARGMAVLAWSPFAGGRLAAPADDRSRAVAALLDAKAGEYDVPRSAALLQLDHGASGGADSDCRHPGYRTHCRDTAGAEAALDPRAMVCRTGSIDGGETAMTSCEVSWFSALCDDDYEFLGVPDPKLQSSWEHCRDIVVQAETGGFDNILLPSGYALGIDTTAFAAAIATLVQPYPPVDGGAHRRKLAAATGAADRHDRPHPRRPADGQHHLVGHARRERLAPRRAMPARWRRCRSSRRC